MCGGFALLVVLFIL
ncbi:YjcZ family sporulation protein [Bacillus toyonensis]